MIPKVCIIGAGSSGIVAAKALKDKAINFICYEKGSGIGGNWRYNNDNGMSSAYRSLHINTNRDIMSYSDYPMPKSMAMFPHHTEILQYFESYVDHFDLRKYIKFGQGVVKVEKLGERHYKVNLTDDTAHYFTDVIVCNGHHWNPRYPEPSYPGEFSGEILHVHHYRTPDVLEGKSIVILGFGNSAVDIACEAARLHTCKEVTIATRSGAYIIPNWLMSTPFDKLANPLTAKLPLSIQRALLKATLWLARGKQEDYGIPTPNRPILSEHPTISQDLLNLAGRGLVKVKPNIKSFDGKKIFFDDGTFQEADLLIYATGYKITFPFFDDDFLNVEKDNDLKLYKRVVHPDHEGLYFLGFVQPLGPIMPLAEAQAKWVANILTGEAILPASKNQLDSIKADEVSLKKRYKSSPRHTIQVDFYHYKSEIEKELRKR